MRKLSIVIPVLNEVEIIGETLTALQPFRKRGHEILVMDGGSDDGTIALARQQADEVVTVARGRASQMNAGARLAHNPVLLFLHADTRLPALADVGVLSELDRTGRQWGRFDVQLSGKQPLLRLVERMMSLRSRITHIATGDQAIFVDRQLFERIGGYPELALMEDIVLSQRLRAQGPPVCLWSRVVTASRRWERNGILRTIVKMWYLRAAFALGADPAKLARLYN